jgi:hypothetical protein
MVARGQGRAVVQPAGFLPIEPCNSQVGGSQKAATDLARVGAKNALRLLGRRDYTMKTVIIRESQEPMQGKPSSLSLPWLLGGVVFLALFLAFLLHFRDDASPTRQLADKATRVDMVARIQLSLASESAAEKSAVLAITDQDSQTFADQARAALAAVERDQQEVAALLATSGSQHEKDVLAQFTLAFGHLKDLDEEVLGLAVKNTNLKAFGLLFGAAASALAEMDSALARTLAKRADAPNAKRVMAMAFGARLGMLRIQTLLAPHIAEESDTKMDQMEAAMGKEEEEVGKDLDGLTALAKPDGDADLATAMSQFARYQALKAQILSLSRQNTNVRSLALSLNQKRKALAVCLDALNALKVAILEEPIAGVTYGRPPKPR